MTPKRVVRMGWIYTEDFRTQPQYEYVNVFTNKEFMTKSGYITQVELREIKEKFIRTRKKK